jgi:DNA polymerase III alpha subunit
MTAGGEVVEDTGHVGLTLRNHPVSFLRGDLHRQHIVTCAEAMQARDGRWLRTLGLFITIEDETGIANLVIWPKLLERQRRVVLSARMMAVHGRIQREGEVVHLIAHHLTDLSGALASVAGRDAVFHCRMGAATNWITAVEEGSDRRGDAGDMNMQLVLAATGGRINCHSDLVAWEPASGP